MKASTRSGIDAEVVVVELLALGAAWRRRACGRCVDQVGALVEEVLVDQEVLLLGPDRREDALGAVVAEQAPGRAPPTCESASIERSSGVFLSSASPVHETNAVGMHEVAPLGFSMMKAGLVGSQAV